MQVLRISINANDAFLRLNYPRPEIPLSRLMANFSFSDYHIISNGQYKIMITGPNVGSLLQTISISNKTSHVRCIAFCLFWLTHFWIEGDFLV